MISRCAQIITALTILLVPLFHISTTQAADLDDRSIRISDSLPSTTNVSYDISFTVPSFTTLGSMEFEYCTNSPIVGAPCTAPTGFSALSTTLSTQNGETGFSIHPTSTVNRTVIGRVPVNAVGAPVSYVFTGITNPSTSNLPVYVRISTFATNDGSGGRTDSGTVVFSTASAVLVNGYVPPYLTFCVGITVALDCNTTGGNFLSFGELKANQTRSLSSEFSGSTNDPGGFATFINGNTMTSGNNTIPAMGTPGISLPGVSQFGMNLRGNSSPTIGAEPTGPGTSLSEPNFDIPNNYYFASGLITNSPLPTEFRKFTASYIVNVSNSQNPGTYSTTLTYVAVAAF